MASTAKERAIEVVKSLPDQATINDVIERLCFLAKIEEGLRQSEAGRVVPHSDVKQPFLA